MGRRRLGTIAAIVGLVGAMVSSSIAKTPREVMTFAQTTRAISKGTTEPVIVAHRGNGCGGEENSILTLERCIANGVRAVEADVRYTSDGVPILLHDNGILRTTGRFGTVRELPYAQLRQYRLFDGSPIPRLEDVLRRYRGRLVFDLDMKEPRLEPTVDAIARTDSFASVYLRIFLDEQYAQVRGLQARYPALRVMPSLHKESDLEGVRSHGFPYRIIEVPQGFRPEFIHELLATGVTVQSRIAHPFFQCQQYARMRMEGISIIQTDAPITVLEECMESRDEIAMNERSR